MAASKISAKSIISKIVKKIAGNDNLIARFKKSPKAVIKELLDIDLSGDILETVKNAVLAKVSADKLSDTLGSLKNLLGK